MFNLRSKFVVRCVLFVLVLATFFVASPSLSAAPPDDGLFIDTTQSVLGLRSVADATIVRSRYVDLRLSLFDSSIAPTQSKAAQVPAKTLKLNLFPDVTLTAMLDKATLKPNGLIWTGRVDGVAGSRVVFTLNKGALAGNIVTPKASYRVRYAGNNLHQVSQFNPQAFPAERKPLVVDKTKLATTQALQNKDDGSQIDLLVLYTPAARDAAMGTDSIRGLITAAVEESNLALSDSVITPRVNLVESLEIAYTEFGDFDTDLARLQNPSDGFMDDGITLRNKYGADVVTLVIEGSQYCGVAYDIMNPVSASFAPYAFNVVARNCMIGNWTFVHELGHLMSARHDWMNDSTDNAPFTYNHGYVLPSKTARTIMAYPDNCPLGCPRIGYFSNPDLNYNGEALGVPEGLPKAADNRKTLNATASTVANFRQHLGIVVAPTTPILITPQGMITATRQPTFTWNVSSGATSYLLWVDGPTGNLVKQWYDATAICTMTTCSVPSTSVLDNGLYSWFVKAWNSAGDSGWATPLSFTINGVPDAPKLISPNGTEVVSPVTFTWYSASNATSYNLTVAGNTTSVPSGNCTGSTCAAAVTLTLSPGSYLWSVQACNAAGCSNSSAYWTFIIPDDRPKGVSPSGTITDNPPFFVWTQPRNPSVNNYILWVKGVNNTFENTWQLQVNSTLCVAGGNCTFKPPVTFPAGEYTWQVRACNGGACTNWSDALRFTFSSPVCSITMLEPQGKPNTNKPTFRWSYTGDCQWFYLGISGPRQDARWLNRDPQNCLNGTCAWTPDWNFQNGKYSWYIYGGPNGKWFGPLSFEIGIPTVPGFVSPPWDGWKFTRGSWIPVGNMATPMLFTTTTKGYFSSAYYDLAEYSNLDYETTLLRYGCATCSFGVDVRGAPGSPDGGWLNAYQFHINRSGYFSVWRGVNDQWTALQNWTFSPAIRKGDTWNTLRVLALGSNLYYYINGTLVWTGSDVLLTSGKVGAFVAHTGATTTTSDVFVIQNGKLTVPGVTTMSMPDVSADQKARNDDANKSKQGSKDQGPQ